jgi:hypothetical protein
MRLPACPVDPAGAVTLKCRSTRELDSHELERAKKSHPVKQDRCVSSMMRGTGKILTTERSSGAVQHYRAMAVFKQQCEVRIRIIPSIYKATAMFGFSI